jgi:glycerophosphoryl diester phosphodiesterase
VIAHRGGALEAPENTLLAVEHALTAGADGVEIDVRLTRDEEVVVVHDQALQLSQTDRVKTPLAEITFKRLKRFDAGLRFNGRRTAIRVPRLEEVLSAIPRRTILMVEVKRRDREELLARRTAEIVAGCPSRPDVVWGSFSPFIVRTLAASAPRIPIVAIIEDEDAIQEFRGLPVAIYALAKDLATPALIQKLQRKGAGVWVWTVRTLTEAGRLAGLGVDGLISDIPARLVRHLTGRPGSGRNFR